MDKDVCGIVGFGCSEDDCAAVEALDERAMRWSRAVAAELGLCDRERGCEGACQPHTRNGRCGPATRMQKRLGRRCVLRHRLLHRNRHVQTGAVQPHLCLATTTSNDSNENNDSEKESLTQRRKRKEKKQKDVPWHFGFFHSLSSFDAIHDHCHITSAMSLC